MLRNCVPDRANYFFATAEQFLPRTLSVPPRILLSAFEQHSEEWSVASEYSNSVTKWIADLKQGSEDAADLLWRRYFQKLVAVAKTKLAKAPKRVSDEEDLALNVFKSLCAGAESGRFEKLTDREELWKLLVVMTRNKSLNQMREQRAQKRGKGAVRGQSIFQDSKTDNLDIFLGDEPTPDFLVEVHEERERLLSLLVGKDHRAIAELRLDGHSIEETAAELGISPRSVKRKLALIRDTWVVELEEGS